MNMQYIPADLVERQFQQWENFKNQKANPGKIEKQSTTLKRPLITISSEPGIDISSIIPMLTRELGLDLFDAEIVDLIAKNAHLSRRMVETLDEKTRSVLDDWLAEEIFVDEFTSKEYLQNLRAVVFSIAAHGNAVIIGRGGAFLIQPENRLALRLVAPHAERLKHVMTEQRLSEQESREYIDKITHRHHSFVKRHFHADLEDPANYSIVINTGLIKPEAILEIVKTILNRKEPL